MNGFFPLSACVAVLAACPYSRARTGNSGAALVPALRRTCNAGRAARGESAPQLPHCPSHIIITNLCGCCGCCADAAQEVSTGAGRAETGTHRQRRGQLLATGMRRSGALSLALRDCAGTHDTLLATPAHRRAPAGRRDSNPPQPRRLPCLLALLATAQPQPPCPLAPSILTRFPSPLDQIAPRQPLRLDIKRQLFARSDRVKCVDLHPTEPWLLSSLYSGHLHVWNYETQVWAVFVLCAMPSLPFFAAHHLSLPPSPSSLDHGQVL